MTPLVTLIKWQAFEIVFSSSHSITNWLCTDCMCFWNASAMTQYSGPVTDDPIAHSFWKSHLGLAHCIYPRVATDNEDPIGEGGREMGTQSFVSVHGHAYTCSSSTSTSMTGRHSQQRIVNGHLPEKLNIKHFMFLLISSRSHITIITYHKSIL